MNIRSFCVYLAALLLLVSSSANAAPGVVDLSWQACAPVINQATAIPDIPMSAFASVLGNDERHSAYLVQILVGDASDNSPDAWHFDAPGCQSSALITIDHLAPAIVVKTCPSFQGANASLQIKDFSFVPPALNLPPNLLRGTLANAYPDGQQSNPAQRQFLVPFYFDHSFSVFGPTTPGTDCGGFETPMVLRLLAASYIRQSTGEEILFDVGNRSLGVNGAVPADRSTWGQIKNTYRR